jgi:GntR family transcriptional regulator
MRSRPPATGWHMRPERIESVAQENAGAVVVRGSPVPLYLQIEEELRGLVKSGELPALSRVPSENELTERFSVSRMTARKALDRLVADGILFRRPGKGTFVAPPKISHGPSQQLSFSAAMRALGLRHDTRVLEAGLMPAPQPIASALGVRGGTPVVVVRRLRLVEGEPVAIHFSHLPPTYANLLDGDLRGSLTDLMLSAGARVAHSRDTVEAVVAAAEEARLLGVSIGAPLIRIEGVAFSSSGEPLRYTEAIYRGDRFRFTIDTAEPADLKVELKSEAAPDSAGTVAGTDRRG